MNLVPSDADNEGPAAHHLPEDQTNQQAKRLSCDECEYRTNHLGNMKKHHRRHSGVKPYRCFQCDYSAISQSQLTVHARQHTGERPHQCRQCDYAAISSSHLTRHLLRHSGDRPHHCHHCDYTCSRRDNLTIHIRLRHSTGRDDNKHACTVDECDFIGNSWNALRAHERRRHATDDYKTRAFPCDHCEYAATTKGNLGIHQRIHTGVRPYQCLQCEYACTQSSSLKSHVLRRHPPVPNETALLPQ